MSKLTEFVQTVGLDIKNLTLNVGNLTTLTTDEKSTIVGALNEILQRLNNVGGGGAGGGVQMQDVERKINEAISTLENKIKGGQLAEELDSLSEIAAKITGIISSDSVQEALLQRLGQLSDHVEALKTQAETDYLAIYKRAKGE